MASDGWLRVAAASDIRPGEGRVVEAGARTLALFNVNGSYYALDNACTHRGGPLGEGYVDCANGTVQCPWHGWTFALASGVSPVNALAKVEPFDVRVEGDEILVSLE